jgi:hypothetical protein
LLVHFRLFPAVMKRPRNTEVFCGTLSVRRHYSLPPAQGLGGRCPPSCLCLFG